MKKYNFKEVDKIEKISGVYQIVNELNGHRYIGSSKNIQHRILTHRSSLRRNNHHSIYLQNAFNKYGEDKFYIQILEKCENVRSTILFLEQKYLDLNPEYNISDTATCPINVLQTEEIKQKRAEKLRGQKRNKQQRQRISNGALQAKRGIPVNCYDLDGNYIRTFHSSREAERSLNGKLKGVTIIGCCKNKNKSAYGFMWRYDNGDHSNIDPYENNSLNAIQQFKRPVLQLDDNYNIVNEFESISDASRYLNKPYAISNIARCAKGFVKHAVGYIWRYKDKLNNNIHDYEQQP